uniref:Uncharacterized protein n=1 Tax=Oryza glumipatula TaxID=40148 RepID=A0A0E0ASX6_9ORYZ
MKFLCHRSVPVSLASSTAGFSPKSTKPKSSLTSAWEKVTRSNIATSLGYLYTICFHIADLRGFHMQVPLLGFLEIHQRQSH